MTTPLQSMVECRSCGAGAPVDAHFCPQCSRILALGRHGDYYSFFGLPRRLEIDAALLERRFRELSRQFHPDYFYNATPAERLASLERTSYLNDAYRTLKDPASRAAYLLGLEGFELARPGEGPKVPPSLLEEVFALNEELDEIREARETGAAPETLRARLEAARRPIERKRDEHEADLRRLCADWDARQDRATLQALRDRMLERNYINNLLAGIEKEAAGLQS